MMFGVYNEKWSRGAGSCQLNEGPIHALWRKATTRHLQITLLTNKAAASVRRLRYPWVWHRRTSDHLYFSMLGAQPSRRFQIHHNQLRRIVTTTVDCSSIYKMPISAPVPADTMASAVPTCRGWSDPRPQRGWHV